MKQNKLIMKSFLAWRRNFIINNPNISTTLAFVKGVVFTIIFYEFFK